MTQTADAIIIGGGIVGASIAYHLAKGGLRNVLVLERQPLLGMGSSAASAGVIYHHLPEKVNLRLSRKSLHALLEFEDEFETKIDFHRSGCIQTAGTPEDMSILRNMHEELLSMGVDSRLLSTDELAGLLPGIVADGLLSAIYTPNDGYFDPHGMIQGYAAAARRLGTKFLTSTPASGFVKEGTRVLGVRTPAGDISTEIVVNAAGPAAAEVARLAGVPDLPVVPFKRQIFITAPTRVISANAPFYFDKTPPFYFRPESGGLLMSIAELWECRNGDLSVDWSSVGILAERASRRFPEMNSLRIMRGWAGLREMTPDNTAILGPVPGITGFFCAVGFSGHGVMHAPLTGRIVASMILTGNLDRYEDIELAPLLYSRFHSLR